MTDRQADIAASLRVIKVAVTFIAYVISAGIGAAGYLLLAT